MFFTICKRAFSVLLKKPLKLWGISLLSILLTYVLGLLCGVSIPGLALCVGLLIDTSMTMIYLYGYRGQEVESKQLFTCFKDWKTIKRVLCGMGWMNLWIFLWGLIPFAGFVFAIIKGYEYSLVPYILVTEPDVSITDAIKVSKERTNGYKWHMFLSNFLPKIAVSVILGTLALMGMIPAVGWLLFGIPAAVLSIVWTVLQPLYFGLVNAAYYEEITNPTIALEAPKADDKPNAFCSKCGASVDADTVFCSKCGNKVN